MMELLSKFLSFLIQNCTTFSFDLHLRFGWLILVRLNVPNDPKQRRLNGEWNQQGERGKEKQTNTMAQEKQI